MNASLVFSEKGSIIEALATALGRKPAKATSGAVKKFNQILASVLPARGRACFSEQDSRRSNIVRRREPTGGAQPSAASFHSRPGSLPQFGNCGRILTRNRQRLWQRNRSEPGDPVLRLSTGNSFCFLTAAGSPRDVTGLQQAGLWDRPCAKESCLTQDSPRRDVVSRQGPVDHIAKTKMANKLSGNPPSAVVTGRVLGPAQSRRDPCTEISP